MNILIMGGPGAGKGSQAELIKKHYNLAHISTGDMFRNEIKIGSVIGKQINEYVSKGELVSDDITFSIIEERFSKDDIKRGFMLDGFPRNIHQAYKLNSLLKKYNMKVNAVLNITSSDEILIKRISGRRVCSSCGEGYHIENKKPLIENHCDKCKNTLSVRNDDNVETIKTRIAIYHEQFDPLLKYYENIVFNVNGEGLISDIFVEVSRILNSL